MQGKSTHTGDPASATIEQLRDSAQQGPRSGRAFSVQASRAMLDSDSTQVSVVLIGVSEVLQPERASSAPSRAKKG